MKDLAMEGFESSESDSDLVEALLALGYPASEAREAIRKIDAEITDLNKRVSEALKIINQK